MMRWIVSGVGGAVAVSALAVLWQASGGVAPPAGAQAAAPAPGAGEDWGSPDGGAVVIKPGRLYSILVEDQGDHSSVFSEGHVLSRTDAPDGGRTYQLKPTTPGQAAWSFTVIAKPDGTAELYMTKGGARHLVCTLKK